MLAFVDTFVSDQVQVTIESSSGDSETLTLAADSLTNFSAVIDSVSGSANPGDGLLQISVDDTLTVTYLDLDNGIGGTSTVTDTAFVFLDDHGDDFTNATPLDASLSALGQIDAVGDIDWFSFNAVAGEKYQFTSNGSSGFNNPSGELSLYDTDGTTLLDFDSEFGEQVVIWEAPADGIYYLLVEADTFSSFRTYELTGEIIAPDDHADSAFSATTFDPQSSVLGEIQNERDEDWFVFTAVGGTKYEFQANGDSPFTNENGELSLYDTDGITLLETDDSFRRPTISWTAPADGDYYLGLGVRFSFGLGTYELTGRVSDDHADNAEFASAFDPLSSVAGELETGSDEDWFAFTAVAGTKYEFTADGNDPFTNDRGELSLFDSDGTTLLENDRTSGVQTIAWTAPDDGEYYLAVGSIFSSFGFGTYELTGMLAADDHADNPIGATRISPSAVTPRTVLGDIENSEDEDWFLFSAFGGIEYEFEADGGSPFSNTFGTLTLYDTDGVTELDSDQSTFRQDISWVAPATGTYYLAVGADSTFTFGDYELTVEAFVPETGVSFSDSPSVNIGPLEVKVTNFTFPSNAEVTITSSSGDSESLVLEGLGIYSTIINSESGVVTQDDGTLQVEMGETLTVTYFDGEVTFTNTVTIDFDDHADSASNATPVTVAFNEQAEIEDRDDADWFVFTAVAGTKYEFTANNERGDLNLYDTNGTTLLANDDTNDLQAITWLAPDDGEYFISVEARFSFGFGVYDLTGALATDDFADSAANATPLTTSTVLGEIELVDDQDWFVFTAVEGVEYEFAANGSLPFTNRLGDLSLYDTDGITLLDFNSFSNVQEISWVAPADGDYFLSIESGSSFTFGTYELTTSVPLSTLEFESTGFPTVGTIGVSAFDITNSGTVVVTIEASSGDSETVTLDSIDGSNFTAFIDSVDSTSVTVGDGTLQVSAGDTLTVTYSDPNPDIGFGDLVSTATIFSDDHGDDAASATPLSDQLNAAGEIQGKLDQDWFSFSAVAGLNYEFATTLDTLADSVLRLYDTDGITELASNDDGGPSLGSVINFQAPTSGVYLLSVESFNSTSTGTFELAGVSSGEVLGQHLFYDGSSFDGDAGVHSANDDAAIDVSKSPLLTGTATFENYSNFENGITGIFIDVDGVRTDPTIDDFEFRVGNSSDPSAWSLLDVAPDISVRFGAGELGSDRISLIFPAGTIVDQWVQVRLLADGPGNIVGIDDVHYWGNQRGDTGNSATNTAVNSGDVSNVNANFSGLATVSVDSNFDVNKDGRVNSGDSSAVSARFSGFSPTLQLIDLPSVTAQLQASSGTLLAQSNISSLEVARAVTVDTSTVSSVQSVIKFDGNTGEQMIDSPLVFSTPVLTVPTSQFVTQARTAPVVEVNLPESDGSMLRVAEQSETQPVDRSDLDAKRLGRRLDRVQRVIARLDSQSDLTARQQKRLENMMGREERILLAIDQQFETAEFGDSVHHNDLDAAFSGLDSTDLSVI